MMLRRCCWFQWVRDVGSLRQTTLGDVFELQPEPAGFAYDPGLVQADRFEYDSGPERKYRAVVLGLDPGLKHFGVAVLVEREDGGHACLFGEAIETDPTPKKQRRHLRVSVDDQRRMHELWKRVAHGPAERWKPTAVAVEAHQPFAGAGHGHANSWKTGVVYGMCHGIAYHLGVPLFLTYPFDLKRDIAKKKTASKQEVEVAICARVSGLRGILEALPDDAREHVADAAGHAFLALGQLSEIRSLGG